MLAKLSGWHVAGLLVVLAMMFAMVEAAYATLTTETGRTIVRARMSRMMH